MIGPSQRQRDLNRPARDWSVHRSLARVRDRNRHLLHASLLALLAALVGWLLGLDLAARAGLVTVAAALAWLVPLRGSNEWALTWIGEQAGLSYQTALEMNDDSDPYGLRAAVEARADASLARVQRPEHSAWWLPLLALAAGALLLPALPLGGSAGPAGGSIPPGWTGPAPVDASDEEQREEPTPNLPGEDRTRIARSQETGQPADERGQEGDESADGRAGEREALERYLRSIRERPEALAQEQDPAEEGANAAPSGRAPQEGAQERQGGGERSSQQDRSGEGDGDRSGEQSGAEGQEQGQPGEEGGEQGQQNPFAPTGSNENQDESEGGEPAEAAAPEDGGPDEEQLQAGGEEASGAGDSPQGGDQQGQGEGAGGLPSAEQEAGRAGQSDGETIQLRGDLREGPLSSGGTIQLPGGDEVELPPGRTAESYAREVESAVTEGRVPLEYQEIIRNYFR